MYFGFCLNTIESVKVLSTSYSNTETDSGVSLSKASVTNPLTESESIYEPVEKTYL